VTGAELDQMLTSQLQRPRFRSRSLGVSGLQVVVDCVDEQLEVDVRRPTGAPLGATDRLVLATTDFMAARLDSARAARLGSSKELPHGLPTPVGQSLPGLSEVEGSSASQASDARDPEAGRARIAPGTYSDAPLVREVAARWISARGGTLQAARFADPGRPRWVRTARATTGCQRRAAL
jgi:hypothetical protein